MDKGGLCETEPEGQSPRHDPGFRWTVLQRHGKRPLAVLGRTLLRADNRCTGLPCWSEITILETSGRRFAASLRHAQPLAPWCDAWLCDTPEGLRTAFLTHDAMAALSPLGAMASYDGVAREVMVRQRFRCAWTGLLAAVFGLPATLRDAA